jgi:FAD/FMN-containing dehydrogenase
VTDVCVPVSRLAECIKETKADIEKTDLLAPIISHVGDGNFHVSFFLTPRARTSCQSAGDKPADGRARDRDGRHAPASTGGLRQGRVPGG